MSIETIDFKNLESIVEYGFSDPVTIGQLWESGFPEDPDLAKPGVYLVLRPKNDKNDPLFLSRREGRNFERDHKYRNYEAAKLKERWIPGAIVLYIGKAGGPSQKKTLKKRLSELVRFGQGKAAPHKGGRAIWQIPEPQDLLISWRCCMGREDPADVECCLLKEFKKRYDELPFANWRMPRRC